MNINNSIKTIVIFGKPCSGKTTQANLLAQKFGFQLFSIGEVFRNISKNPTNQIEEKIAATVIEGRHLPYWLAAFHFTDKLLSLKADEGIILEGVGRTAQEAYIFHDIMTWLFRPYKAVLLNISNVEVMRRLALRQNIDKRADDTNNIMKKRLSEYEQQAVSGFNVFCKLNVAIQLNGERAPDRITKEIIKNIGIQKST